MHYILYVALSGFYVKAVLARLPELVGWPLILHHDGVVVEASREAGERSVRPGMGLPEAQSLLREEGKFLPLVAAEFEKERNRWLDLALTISDRIEPESPASAWIDLTGQVNQPEIANRFLHQLVRQEGVGLTGAMATSKWLAKVLAQPVDGQALALGLPVIEPVREQWVLDQLSPHDLTPLDPAIRERLVLMGYRQVAGVKAISLKTLADQFGKKGLLVHQVVRNAWRGTFVPSYPEAAWSETFRFESATGDRLMIDRALGLLCRVGQTTLTSRDLAAKEIVLLGEGEEGDVTQQRRALAKPVQAASGLLASCQQFLRESPPRGPMASYRLILAGLTPAVRIQRTLEGLTGPKERKLAAHTAFLKARETYGDQVVKTASEVTVERRIEVLRAWKNATGWN